MNGNEHTARVPRINLLFVANTIAYRWRTDRPCVTVAAMMSDLRDFRLVTASAYPGMMAPLTTHPSCICVLSGDADRTLGQPNGQDPAATLSLEALDGVRRRWRFGDVARLADFVPKVLADETRTDRRPILLIPPRASAAWEAAATAWPAKVRVAASPRPVVEPIAEDKIQVREWLRRIDIPVPTAIATADVDFKTIAATLGVPFVMQAPSGAGGQGTFLIHTLQDAQRAQAQQPHVDRWLLSRFCGELTINVSGIAHADGVRQLPVSIQTSGVPRLGVDFGAYCGSDFVAAANLPDAVLVQAAQICARIGQWLQERGHRGVFGADVAVDGQELAVLEVNPRIQGSSWLVGCLEQHVMAILGAPVPACTEAPAPGSHLLVRWSGPAGVIHAVPAAAEGITALPTVGTTVLPGAIIARIQAPHSLALPGGRELQPSTHALLDRLLESFEITTANV